MTEQGEGSAVRTQGSSLVPGRTGRSKPIERRADGGNVQLMEPRACELFLSIRTLLRSNEELKHALLQTPGDTDFSEAILENRSTIRSQRSLAIELITDMRRQGANIDLPDDIRVCAIDIKDGETEERKEQSDEQSNAETENGVYL